MAAYAQTASPSAAPPTADSQPTASPEPDQLLQPGGKVLFSRDADAALDSSSAIIPAPAQNDSLHVTDAERAALSFIAYGLDVHLTPVSAGISVRSALTVFSTEVAAHRAGVCTGGDRRPLLPAPLRDHAGV